MSLAGGLKSLREIHPIRIMRGVAEAEKSRKKNSECDKKTDDKIGVLK
jgi:hypothetical protein